MNQGLPDLKSIVEIKALIDQVSKISAQLAENEVEMYNELSQKYAEPCRIGPEDKLLLELMLRNVKIRSDKGL